MKKSFIKNAFVALISLFVLTSCFDSLLPHSESQNESKNTETETHKDSETSSTPSGKVELDVHTDNKLSKSEDDDHYNLTLAPGESYTVNVDLTGASDGYYISYDLSGNITYITLDGSTLTADEYIPEDNQAMLRIGLRKTGSEYYYGYKHVNISLLKSDDEYQITLQTDKNLILDGDTYRLMLEVGEEYDLHPSLEGIANYLTFEYSSSKSAFTVDENGHVKASDEASVGDYSYISIYAYYKQSYLCYVGISAKVMENNWDIDIILSEGEEPVSVENVGLTSYKYKITVPYSGIFYKLPEISVTGYEGNGKVIVEKIDEEDKVEFKEEGNDTYFRLLPSSTGYVKFNLSLYEDETFIKKVTANIVLSRLGPGEYKLYYGEDLIEVKDGDTLYLEKGSQTYFYPYYNGKSLHGLSTTLTFTNSDIISFYYYTSLRAIKEGETVLTSSYSSTDSEGTKYTYNIEFTVRIVHEGIPVKLYAAGEEDSFTYKEGLLSINGKIFVEYDSGLTKVVNGDENLSYVLEDTDEEGIKKITLSYEEKNITVSCEYLIGNVKDYEKTDVSFTYEDVFKARTYGCTPVNGDVRVLVLPMWFNDSNEFINAELEDANGLTQKEQILEDLHNVVFGDNEDVGYRSIKSYYEEESFNKVTISGEVAPWYDDNHSYTFYKKGQEEDIRDLIENAIDNYFASSGKTLEDFDGNDDGIIDAIMLYYGSNYHDTNNSSRAYCYRFYTSEHQRFRNFTWISAFDIYGLSGATDLTKQLATNDLSTLNFSKGYILDSFTSLHEFGHSLGVFDYYDEQASEHDNNSPAGKFSMQDNNNGGHEPYSVMTYGWANPYIFDASSISKGQSFDITINDFQSTHDFVMLTPSYDEERQAFDEYLLLELFTPTGLNEYYANNNNYQDIGIRLWHVNAILNDSLTHNYSNFSASSNYDLLHWIRNSEDASFKDSSRLIDHPEYLFQEGDSFDMNTFKSQFFNQTGLLDNGKALNFSFTVTSLEMKNSASARATIHIERI